MKFLWYSLAGLALIGWYGTQSGASPQMDTATAQRDAGVWFVEQLERDKFGHPARRTAAMNKCVAQYLTGNRVDWVKAKNCYSFMVAWQ